jgi:hypothetical protein
MHPSGYGWFSGAPDGDERWTDSEGASGVGDWDIGERRRERGRAA